MKWNFSKSELEQIDSHFLSRSGASKLLVKVRQSALFPFAEMQAHPEDPGYWVVVVRDPDSKTISTINSMYHFKTLCIRNGVNLKALLAKNTRLDPNPESRRGFKTMGRAARALQSAQQKALPSPKFEDMLK